MGALSVFLALVLFVFPALDSAADTGGSMGGGDWSSSSGGGGAGGGDSGGGYSSSGGGYSGGTSSDNYSYSYSGGDSSPGGGCNESSRSSSSDDSISSDESHTGIVIGLIIFVAVVAYLLFSALSSSALDDYSPRDDIDVSVMRVAIDGRARRFVQNELERMARNADTKTSVGRCNLLRDVCLLLRRLHDTWVYGGAVDSPMQPLGSAKIAFDRHVDDARSRFREETIRNEQGTVTETAASEYRPRSGEGEGLILVTVVIAARRELFTVGKIGDGHNLRLALEAACQLPASALVATEIVWQPSEERDRLSSMELEAKYPQADLVRLDGAVVGKMFCTYCGGPFPAELVSCPHCGAPAKDVARTVC